MKEEYKYLSSDDKRHFVTSSDGTYAGLVVHDGNGIEDDGYVWADDVARALCREARVGKYIDLNKLNKMDFQKLLLNDHFAMIADHQRRYCNWNIGLLGNDALAHLCLPYTAFAGLIESDHILSISELQAHAQNGTLKQTKTGRDWGQSILRLIYVWEQIPDLKDTSTRPD